jgi:hypothetical protein
LRRVAAWAKAAVESRVGELETQLVDVVRQTSTALEAFEHEIAFVTGENRELKAKLLQLETSLAELRLDDARGDRKAIDLQDPLTRVI